MSIISDYQDSFQSAAMTERERFNLIKESETTFIPSDFLFLKEIKGIRPKRFTSLLSSTGAGKSTLSRSIAIEAARTGIVFCWLTEEYGNDFKLGLSRTNTPNKILNNIKIFSEKDHKYEKNVDTTKFISDMEEKLRLLNPVLIICDNLTTSVIYVERWDIQGQVVDEMGRMAANLGCGLLVVLHTKSEITENYRGLICVEDVRGTKIIAIKSDYFYIMQEFKVDMMRYTTIRIEKSRHTQIKNKLFLIEYSSQRNMFVGDRIINFEKFKELFNSRNKL